MPACHEPASAPPPDNSSHAGEAEEPTAPGGRTSELPNRVNIAFPGETPDRWLVVERVDDGAAGAWATGSFDRERNKLSIRTHDVRQFAVDLSRIPIRWDKLVIVSIDGKNSELVRREHPVLHFLHDKYGWRVIEQ
ncbi:MAG: hypothetical protein ACE5HE_13055 [Phycisphaerae bacterium]